MVELEPCAIELLRTPILQLDPWSTALLITPIVGLEPYTIELLRTSMIGLEPCAIELQRTPIVELEQCVRINENTEYVLYNAGLHHKLLPLSSTVSLDDHIYLMCIMIFCFVINFEK
jgi:hypothetical protein